MKAKVLSEADCVVGWFTTIKSRHRGQTHIIYRKKPICNSYVDRLADLDVISFKMDLKDVECAICKKVWSKNKKNEWRKYS